MSPTTVDTQKLLTSVRFWGNPGHCVAVYAASRSETSSNGFCFREGRRCAFGQVLLAAEDFANRGDRGYISPAKGGRVWPLFVAQVCTDGESRSRQKVLPESAKPPVDCSKAAFELVCNTTSDQFRFPTSGKMAMIPGIQRLTYFLIAFLLAPVPDATAQDWGTIRGRIVYGGDAPAPVKLDIERDAEVCGKVGLVDESLAVNKENRGIRYVAIWLESKEAVPVHPDLQNFPAEAPSLDNVDCRFEPHMLAVRTGQVLQMKNSDPVAHNAAVYVRRTTPFSEIIPQGMPLEKKFAKAETLPTRVDCSIHAWMKAWLIITDHPYVAVTNANGEFELKNVPAGEWKFRFWHERQGYLTNAAQNGVATPLAKGTWTLKVPGSSVRDLGELVISEDQLAAKKK